METLHITLKRKWFEMTDSGEKPDEYREIKPYWLKRLCTAHRGSIGGDFMDEHKCIAYTFKKFDQVFARNGYKPTNKSWLRKCNGISIGEGKPEWGAEPGKKYFVISLGERIA